MALVRSALRLSRASGTLVQATRGMAEMPLTFAAPSQVFYNQQDVRQVDVPSFRSVTRVTDDRDILPLCPLDFRSSDSGQCCDLVAEKVKYCYFLAFAFYH